MRRIMLVVGCLAVTVAVVVGFVQARDDAGTSAGDPPRALSRAEVSKPLPAGAPPVLAALRARVNELAPGGLKALDAQLRELRGRPTVVNLWASWCGPCAYELPFFQRQAVKRGARVAFLGVNSGDDSVGARRFAGDFPMPYPSFVDPRQQVVGEYAARGLPVTAFYDARGTRVVHQGVIRDEAQLAELIERYALG